MSMVGGFWCGPVGSHPLTVHHTLAPCQESRPEHFPGLSQCLNDAMGVRQHYVELASMAESLCKPKGGRKSQKARSWSNSRVATNVVVTDSKVSAQMYMT